jgi:hypothetical protein
VDDVERGEAERRDLVALLGRELAHRDQLRDDQGLDFS